MPQELLHNFQWHPGAQKLRRTVMAEIMRGEAFMKVERIDRLFHNIMHRSDAESRARRVAAMGDE
jgi:hypothetical protein